MHARHSKISAQDINLPFLNFHFISFNSVLFHHFTMSIDFSKEVSRNLYQYPVISLNLQSTKWNTLSQQHAQCARVARAMDTLEKRNAVNFQYFLQGKILSYDFTGLHCKHCAVPIGLECKYLGRQSSALVYSEIPEQCNAQWDILTFQRL